MAKVVEFLAEARVDFDQSLEWYQRRSAPAALGFASAVDEAVDKIALDPTRFPLALSGCRYCALLRYPFRVVFREAGEQIIVIAIAHAKRRPQYWHRRV